MSLYHELHHVMRAINGLYLKNAKANDYLKYIYDNPEEFAAIMAEVEMLNLFKLSGRVTHNGLAFTSALSGNWEQLQADLIKVFFAGLIERNRIPTKDIDLTILNRLPKIDKDRIEILNYQCNLINKFGNKKIILVAEKNKQELDQILQQKLNLNDELYAAAEKGNYNLVKLLIEKDADCNDLNKNNNTLEFLLKYVDINNQTSINILKLLIKNKVKYFITQLWGDEIKNANYIYILINHGFSSSPDKKSFFAEAVATNHIESVKMLYETGFTINENDIEVWKQVLPAISSLLKGSHPEITSIFCPLLNNRNNIGIVFNWALDTKDNLMINFLINHRPDHVSWVLKDAVENKNTTNAIMLLENGIDTNIQLDDIPLIKYSYLYGSSEISKYVSKHIDANHFKQFLLQSITNDQPDLLAAIIKHNNIDLTTAFEAEENLLMLAVTRMMTTDNRFKIKDAEKIIQLILDNKLCTVDQIQAVLFDKNVQAIRLGREIKYEFYFYNEIIDKILNHPFYSQHLKKISQDQVMVTDTHLTLFTPNEKIDKAPSVKGRPSVPAFNVSAELKEKVAKHTRKKK